MYSRSSEFPLGILVLALVLGILYFRGDRHKVARTRRSLAHVRVFRKALEVAASDVEIEFLPKIRAEIARHNVRIQRFRKRRAFDSPWAPLLSRSRRFRLPEYGRKKQDSLEQAIRNETLDTNNRLLGLLELATDAMFEKAGIVSQLETSIPSEADDPQVSDDSSMIANLRSTTVNGFATNKSGQRPRTADVIDRINIIKTPAGARATFGIVNLDETIGKWRSEFKARREYAHRWLDAEEARAVRQIVESLHRMGHAPITLVSTDVPLFARAASLFQRLSVRFRRHAHGVGRKLEDIRGRSWFI